MAWNQNVLPQFTKTIINQTSFRQIQFYVSLNFLITTLANPHESEYGPGIYYEADL